MSLPACSTTLTENTIVQVGDLARGHREFKAAGAITPGFLIEVDSAGEVVAHATAGGTGRTLVAKEMYGLGNTVDTAYADNDKVFAHEAIPGEKLLVRIKNGETIAIGGKLISDGAGSLKATTGSPTKTFFIADQAVTSASGNPLILATVM